MVDRRVIGIPRRTSRRALWALSEIRLWPRLCQAALRTDCRTESL